MAYEAKGVQVKLFETGNMLELQNEMNSFISELAHEGKQIIDIKYHADKEEYTKHLSGMIVYRAF